MSSERSEASARRAGIDVAKIEAVWDYDSSPLLGRDHLATGGWSAGKHAAGAVDDTQEGSET